MPAPSRVFTSQPGVAGSEPLSVFSDSPACLSVFCTTGSAARLGATCTGPQKGLTTTEDVITSLRTSTVAVSR